MTSPITAPRRDSGAVTISQVMTPAQASAPATPCTNRAMSRRTMCVAKPKMRLATPSRRLGEPQIVDVAGKQRGDRRVEDDVEKDDRRADEEQTAHPPILSSAPSVSSPAGTVGVAR